MLEVTLGKYFEKASSSCYFSFTYEISPKQVIIMEYSMKSGLAGFTTSGLTFRKEKALFLSPLVSMHSQLILPGHRSDQNKSIYTTLLT